MSCAAVVGVVRPPKTDAGVVQWRGFGYTKGVRAWLIVTLVAACGGALVAACGGSPAAQDQDGPSPGGGTPYPMVAPDQGLAAIAADFNGSCAFARPGPGAEHYAIALRVVTDAAVRDSAEFSGAGNRIGTVRAGTHVAGEGPVAGGAGGGSGYGVVVRDSQGRVCRGYVSSSSVTRDDRSDDGGRDRGRIK